MVTSMPAKESRNLTLTWQLLYKQKIRKAAAESTPKTNRWMRYPRGAALTNKSKLCNLKKVTKVKPCLC